MAAYTYPGVYIEEIPSGQHTITGVATSIAAFIGWSNQGPVGEAVMVESWAEYQTIFGGMIPTIYLGYAVYQFFLNGGSQAYIVRLAWTDAVTASNLVAGMTLYANNPGNWGNNLFVLITQPNSSSFINLQVMLASNGQLQTLESYTNLPTPSSTSNIAVTTIDAQSNYISFLAPDATTVSPTPTLGSLPTTSQVQGSVTSGSFVPYELLKQTTSTATAYLIGSVSASGPMTIAQIKGAPDGAGDNWVGLTSGAVFAPTAAPAVTTTVAPVCLNGGTTVGNDGTQLIPSGWGEASGNFETMLNGNGSTIPSAYEVLGNVPIFNLLCVPGETTLASVSALQAFCAQYRAFLIVDAPQNVAAFTVAPSLATLGPLSSDATPASLVDPSASNSAYYFPWVSAPDPASGNVPTLFPPCGFIAGIYAATDASRGVWKAPAGINASLTGALGLQYVINDLQNGQLNPLGVNCLRQFPNFGNVVWGARTIAGSNALGSQWMYVPIRRLALFIESSLYMGTQWAVFEPNAEPLWGQVRMSIGTFMQGLFLQGAFAGTTPQQAYFVKCDDENNTEATTALGILNVTVGFAPLYPAEFVVIQIQQMMNQS